MNFRKNCLLESCIVRHILKNLEQLEDVSRKHCVLQVHVEQDKYWFDYLTSHLLGTLCILFCKVLQCFNWIINRIRAAFVDQHDYFASEIRNYLRIPIRVSLDQFDLLQVLHHRKHPLVLGDKLSTCAEEIAKWFKETWQLFLLAFSEHLRVPGNSLKEP